MHAGGSKLGEHAESWESRREVGRAREKLGEHAGSWASTQNVGRARGKLEEHEKGGDSRDRQTHEPFLF